MKLHKPIGLLIVATVILTACSSPAPVETPLAPIQAETATDSLGGPAYPGQNPTQAERPQAPPTPYSLADASQEPTVEPASTEPAATTQAIVIPSSIYTCNLQGTQLPVWGFSVVQTYRHDPNAYTQGLIFRDGVLYEGTGLRGRSTLRKVALETGEVQQSTDLPENFFGEGIVELGGKIYQITWQEKTGFVYDLASFEKLDEFSYQTEGWGLTHDGQQLIMSDGTDQLYFIDPASFDVRGQVAVADDRGPVYRINELEYVDGEVWGNIYQTACIVRIEPRSGQVTGWIDLTGLHDLALQAGQAPVPAEVPNGIAYDPESKRIFVTGKFWPTLYEIALSPQEAQP